MELHQRVTWYLMSMDYTEEEAKELGIVIIENKNNNPETKLPHLETVDGDAQLWSKMDEILHMKIRGQQVNLVEKLVIEDKVALDAAKRVNFITDAFERAHR